MVGIVSILSIRVASNRSNYLIKPMLLGSSFLLPDSLNFIKLTDNRKGLLKYVLGLFFSYNAVAVYYV
ncbi:MAG: hypothetical protein AUK24_05890 [Syntrophaceae bacterium CG2_30_49_12]|nr:MAG: hypothetical protein AUK24_05890 [Syntrophaceae bacterium CG2_30_49_12]